VKIQKIPENPGIPKNRKNKKKSRKSTKITAGFLVPYPSVNTKIYSYNIILIEFK